MANKTELILGLETGELVAATRFTDSSPITEAGTDAGVLFLHGHDSKRGGYDRYAEAVAATAGSTCLTIDLLGHGASDGLAPSLRIVDHMRAVITAYDALSSQEGVERIGIAGSSFGGYLALMATQERDVASLLMRAPAIYPDHLLHLPRKMVDAQREATDTFRRDERLGEMTDNHAIRAMSEYKGYTLLVRSELDESIPHNVIDAYDQAAQRSAVSEIQGAGHSLDDGEQKDEFQALVVNWATPLAG